MSPRWPGVGPLVPPAPARHPAAPRKGVSRTGWGGSRRNSTAPMDKVTRVPYRQYRVTPTAFPHLVGLASGAFARSIT